MRRISILAFGIVCLLLADDQIPQKLQVSNTQKADFPESGTLHLKNSTGEVRIEGWDQPRVEITTTTTWKSAFTTKTSSAVRDRASAQLAAVKVTTSVQGGEVVVATEFPRERRYLPRPSVGARDFDLEYRIMVPRNAKILVDHDAGEPSSCCAFRRPRSIQSTRRAGSGT